MELVNNFSFIEAAAEELIGPKNCSYHPQDIWTETSKFPHLKCQMMEVNCTQNANEKFNCFFIYNKKQRTQPCIIYLHGLSSYCIEGLHLIQPINANYSLCIYDSRAHGKNKNKKVTYGLKQAGDLYDLIMHLHCQGVQEFYLWGRSMGASTILSFLNIFGSMQPIKKLVNFVVMDSPFYSFQQIAKETIARNMNIPAFLCSPLINVAMNRIYEKEKINLRQLSFQSLHYVKCPAAFIYSRKDQIVNWGHTEKIMKGYGGKILELEGQFSHNEVRPLDITKKAINYLCQNNRKQRKSTQLIKNGHRKGLSISLISAKSIKQQQKQNKATKKVTICPNINKISAKVVPKHGVLSQRRNRNAVQQCSLSYLEKVQVYTARRTPEQMQQRSKSKHKLAPKKFTLTNRRYI